MKSPDSRNEPTPPESDAVRKVARKAVLSWATVVVACAVCLAVFWWQAEQREDDREAASVAACQNRNSAQQAARADNLAILDGLREPFPDPGTAALLDALAAGQSRPELVDTDCDGDGWLTVDDYAIPKPDGLPIQLPPIREDKP